MQEKADKSHPDEEQVKLSEAKSKEVSSSAKSLENSSNDAEEDKAISEIASKTLTDSEADNKVISSIKQEESKNKKIDVKGELELLKSANFDTLMKEGADKDREDKEYQQSLVAPGEQPETQPEMSVTEAFRAGE